MFHLFNTHIFNNLFSLRKNFGHLHLFQDFLVLKKKLLEHLQISLKFRNCLRSYILRLKMKMLNFFLKNRNQHFLSKRLVILSLWLITNLVIWNIFPLGEIEGWRRYKSILLAEPASSSGYWRGIILMMVSVIHKCLNWHKSAAPVLILLIFHSLVSLLLIHIFI